MELLAGAMIDYYVPQGDSANLNGTASESCNHLKRATRDLRAEKSTAATLAAAKATLVTKLTTKTSAQQDQVIYLYTVAREAGLCLPGAGRALYDWVNSIPCSGRWNNPSRSPD